MIVYSLWFALLVMSGLLILPALCKMEILVCSLEYALGLLGSSLNFRHIRAPHTLTFFEVCQHVQATLTSYKDL